MSIPALGSDAGPRLLGRATPASNPWWITNSGYKVLLGLAAAGDFANFYITLSVLTNQYPLITVMVVIALTASALALAHGVGVVWSDRREHRQHLGAGPVAILIGLWLFLGLGAALVRWITPPGSAPSTAAPQFGQTVGATAGGTVLTYHVVAVLLLGLYLASGALAAWIAYLDHDPVRAARRSTWRRLVVVGSWHRRSRRLLARQETMLRRHHDEGSRVERNHLAAVTFRTALAQECKEYARQLIAASLGDPAKTNELTRSPRGEARL